jgi:hypothetical protein
VDLVIEVREVVFVRPLADFVVGPIRVPIVVIATAIPLVEPRLVLTLELVVEDDPVNPSAAVGEAFRRPFVGAIDLEVMFAFPFAFKPIPEGLTATVVAVAVMFE